MIANGDGVALCGEKFVDAKGLERCRVWLADDPSRVLELRADQLRDLLGIAAMLIAAPAERADPRAPAPPTAPSPSPVPAMPVIAWRPGRAS